MRRHLRRCEVKVISGGQTGADRTALEVAKDLGLQTGGVVPKGWRTEAGPDPTLATFGCTQHASPDYPPRTRRNVLDSDGTVWFGRTNSRGYLCTRREAQEANRPFLANPDSRILRNWLALWNIQVLNVAGNTQRENPHIGAMVRMFLSGALPREKP
jgi:hypothetical protein